MFRTSPGIFLSCLFLSPILNGAPISMVCNLALKDISLGKKVAELQYDDSTLRFVLRDYGTFGEPHIIEGYGTKKTLADSNLVTINMGERGQYLFSPAEEGSESAGLLIIGGRTRAFCIPEEN